MRQTKFSKKRQSAGVAHVVLWKDSEKLYRDRDLSHVKWGDGFYDFGKPLDVLNSAVWSPVVEGHYDEGFFVLSKKLQKLS